MITINATDTLFTDSPDAGTAACKCSRCSEVIKEDEMPLRCWPVEGEDAEYRFCESCQGKMGIVQSPTWGI